MFNLSMPELSVILVIALLVFGPGKLPEAGKALGKGMTELRRALSGEGAKDETITIKAEPVEKKVEQTK
ncbi:Sec-independent protein translocase protein TatA [Sporomusa silvacetica DSM 10669]|uniref:Sec-independent protein translocase protein TatA n=1 Tax=Sporomusa silvacetica DSM 10669 TaxID=1123289 RepID=A0ABZ3ISS9_9FIRM|nr:twin-arginine translocase TatA/TatE family subunit [Sporomusa silvacetica]OZC15421.1 Sec-independent protein translocase protein TatAd [Sporomusa silvacetica DSM 10669]